jgi:ribonuclease Z
MTLRLTFLGTGSGKPMPHRGVSSLTLFREGELFMFDCGEGSQIQMSRSSLRPGSLEAIFLTHFHGDHVNGLPGLVGSLTLNQRDRPLDIIGPPGLKRWFRTMRQLNILWPSFQVRLREITQPGIVYEHDDFHVVARPLDHRVPTWGYALREKDRPGRFDVDAARQLGVPAGPLFGRLQSGESIELEDGATVEPGEVLGDPRPGFRMAYCADTKPCDETAELAADADVLIHESTYPAGEEQLAHERGHSTAADAARCAKEAGARRLLLTHISQRYTKLERIRDGAAEIFPAVEVARDLKELSLERRDSS